MKEKAIPMFEDYPDVVEVTQLREILGGISKRLAYQLLTSGKVHSVRIGRAYKSPKTSAIEYLTGEAQCRISVS